MSKGRLRNYGGVGKRYVHFRRGMIAINKEVASAEDTTDSKVANDGGWPKSG